MQGLLSVVVMFSVVLKGVESEEEKAFDVILSS